MQNHELSDLDVTNAQSDSLLCPQSGITESNENAAAQTADEGAAAAGVVP